jgi:uncharacterized membrane protein (DUF373 family)
MHEDQASEPHAESPVFASIGRILSWAERTVFAVVGLLLFVAALGLAWNALPELVSLFTGGSEGAIETTARFLDLILLIMMVAEIGYTVTLSVRGRGLSPRPFLIVGLIAVIRRVLVITVQEVRPTQTSVAWVTKSTVDLAILTLVVLAFVVALVMLRGRTEPRP